MRDPPVLTIVGEIFSDGLFFLTLQDSMILQLLQVLLSLLSLGRGTNGRGRVCGSHRDGGCSIAPFDF